jgi:malonate decarboxylase alpha subunit
MTDTPTWDSRRRSKAARLARAARIADGKVTDTENAVEALEALIEPGDKVVLEGDNQKQADFLSRTLAAVDPARSTICTC